MRSRESAQLHHVVAQQGSIVEHAQHVAQLARACRRVPEHHAGRGPRSERNDDPAAGLCPQALGEPVGEHAVVRGNR